MKFVFVLEGTDPQVDATTDAWNTEVYDGPPKEWAGSRAEIVIADCIDWDKDTRREGEALHIEGDTAALRKAFKAIIALLDANDKYQREAKIAVRVRSMVCPNCQRWNDPIARWHGDGKGKACYGLLNERKALVQAEEPEAPSTPTPQGANEVTKRHINDSGVAETVRRHSLACREQEAQQTREAQILQAGFELGLASGDRVDYEARFHRALQRILASVTPDQLLLKCHSEYGPEFMEALEMAYENIQGEARAALKGYRAKKRRPEVAPASTPSTPHEDTV